MKDLIYIPTKRFVYFDDDGNVLSISNTATTDENFIEVTHAEVANLVSGKEQLHHYCVFFDTIIKTYVLTHRESEYMLDFDINSQIHYVERSITSPADLTIIQNISQSEWVIMLNDLVRLNFSGKNISINSNLMFSIAGYNDVNSLERTINIHLTDLIKNECVTIPFNSQIERDPAALSVYTIKRFDLYHHEVINE